MKAIITAAGYASRLWPLTRDIPKPLLEVKGKPIVEHILSKISEIPDVDEVFIVANSKFYPLFEDWLNEAKATAAVSVPVKLMNDGTTSNDDRLGQVGDIRLVLERENVDDDLLVVAGDNLFNFSLLPAYKLFLQQQSILNPLYESKSYKAARESGSVVIDEETGEFLEFMEKSQTPKSTLISLGIYFFPKQKLRLIEKYLAEKNNPDKMGFFLMWLMRQEKVLGLVYTQKWFDIGWIEALETARNEFAP
ncbi:nucleotidyltransferase family protein [Candidatus Woesearchaeota archaeon]|nr:nucleotidyltransferase family protein [Candidatus Woesearchaeota archaeon]